MKSEIASTVVEGGREREGHGGEAARAAASAGPAGRICTVTPAPTASAGPSTHPEPS